MSDCFCLTCGISGWCCLVGYIIRKGIKEENKKISQEQARSKAGFELENLNKHAAIIGVQAIPVPTGVVYVPNQ